MPTFQELLGSPQQEPQQVGAPVPALVPSPPLSVPPKSGFDRLFAGETLPPTPPTSLPGLIRDSVSVDPSMDTTQDKPPSLSRMETMLQVTQNPLSTEEEKQAAVKARAIDEARTGIVPGFLKQGISILKSPGTLLTATDPEVMMGLPFQPSWEKPLASSLYGVNKVLDFVDKTLLPAPVTEGNFYDNLSTNIGGSAAFLAGGEAMLPETLAAKALALKGSSSLVTRLGGYALEGLPIAGLGAAAESQSLYEEAVASGATPEQALIAYGAGAAIGTTEALPMEMFLGKLSAFSKGGMRDILNNFNLTKETKSLREAVLGYLTEGGQEAGQTVLENWVAKDVAGYDPGRTLDENFWSSFATGGAVGSIFGYGISKLRQGTRNETQNGIQAEYDRKKNSGDPINDLAGSMTPVESLLALTNMKQKLDENLKQESDRAIAQAEATAGLPVTPPVVLGAMEKGAGTNIIPLSFQTPNYQGEEYKNGVDSFSSIENNPVDFRVEKALPRKEDGTPLTVKEALNLTPVVAMESNVYQDILDQQDRNMSKLELGLIEKSFTPEETVQAIKSLSVLKKARQETVDKIKIAHAIVGYAKDYAAAFRAAINPEMKLVITDMAPPGTRKIDQGVFQLTNNVELTPGKKTPVGIVYVNMDNLATEMYYNDKLKIPNFKNRARRRVFEALSHELGHSIAVQHTMNLYKMAEKGTGKEKMDAYRAFVLMQEEYGKWLKDSSGSTQDFLPKTQFAPERALHTLAQMKNPDPTTGNLSPLSERPMTQSMPFKQVNKDYFLSFDEFFAEMTARLAAQGHLSDPVMTKFFTPVLAQYQEVFKTLPELNQNDYGKNWLKFLQAQTLSYKIREELDSVKELDFIDALKGKIPGMDAKNFAGLRADLDNWSGGISYGKNLLQMVKDNPHIPHWNNYLNGVLSWDNYKKKFLVKTEDTIIKWRGLGKKEEGNLSFVLFDEGFNRKLKTTQELSKILSLESLQVYQQVRTQLKDVLEEMRAVSLADTKRSIVDNPEMLQSELDEINKEFDKMKDSGYFPFMRFGKFTITAKAQETLVYNGQTYKKGQLITFPVFEKQRERDLATMELKKEFGTKATVSSSIMAETDFAIQGMPRSLLRSLQKKLENAKVLSPEQKAAFERAIQDSAPFRNFKKQFSKKKNIQGYSLDAQRSFVNYISSGVGHISKVKFADAMREPMMGMQEDVNVMKVIGERAQERQQMRHWMDRHFDYIMNPMNELSALRGAGFVAMLGFGVKSAIVNSTQVLTTTMPYLAARYGDVNANLQIGKAYGTLISWIGGKKEFIDTLPDEKGMIKKPNARKARIAQLFTQGINEDWLDQSLATEIAIARSENNLNKSLFEGTAPRFWHTFSRYSALPFKLVEKMNRFVTAAATYELEFEKNLGDHKKAVFAAKQAVWSTQFENARWNRPEFMRGKKSAALLFTSFVQNQVYFATHDKGATRYILTMLLLAGLAGLPFAEDLEDLVDFAATRLNTMLGSPNPKVMLRQDLRRNLEELHMNPDLVLHGLSQNSFGMGQIGEMTGIPIPRLDLSGSLGMGNIVPMTGIPNQLQNGVDFSKAFEQAATQAAGAGGNIVDSFFQGLFSKNPSDWKKMEKAVPMMAVKNISKSIQMFENGGVFTQGGEPVATFDPHDLRDQLEMVGQGLGFTPTEVSQGWEKILATKDAILFYKTQSSALLLQHNWAILQEDSEAQKKVFEEILKYNDSVPFPEMGLKPKDIRQSARDYIKKQMVTGAGIEGEKKYRRLSDKIEETYPDPVGKEVLRDKGISPSL